MPAARVTKSEKQYIVTYMNGKRERITVPEGCRITYGKLTPPAQGDRFGGDGSGSYAIRVYEGGEGVQVAVFPGVKQFRDVSTIKVERLTSNEAGEPEWVLDEGDDNTQDVADALGKKDSKHDIFEFTHP